MTAKTIITTTRHGPCYINSNTLIGPAVFDILFSRFTLVYKDIHINYSIKVVR